MSETLILGVRFKVGSCPSEEDTFELFGTVRESAAKELIGNWLRSQVGAGKDTSPPVMREEYEIQVHWNPSDDSMRADHNCGNKGLRDGLLLHVFKHLP